MASVNITIEVNNHGSNDVLRPSYRAMSADIQKGEQTFNISDVSGMDVAGFVAHVLQEVVKNAISNGDNAGHDVTITMTTAGAGLTKGAQTFISDIYTSDDVINSITFS